MTRDRRKSNNNRFIVVSAYVFSKCVARNRFRLSSLTSFRSSRKSSGDWEYRKSGAKFSALKLFTCRSGYAEVSKAHSRACQNLRAVFARNYVSYAQSILNATPESNMRKFVLCIGLLGSSISVAHAETLANLPEAIAVKGGVAVVTLRAAGGSKFTLVPRTPKVRWNGLSANRSLRYFKKARRWDAILSDRHGNLRTARLLLANS